MKNFSLTIHVYHKTNQMDMDLIEVIDADSMIELLSKFILIVHNTSTKMNEMDMRAKESLNDDDIPF